MENYQNQESLEEKLSALNNTTDTTSEYDQNDINQNKVMAILAYFGILVLVPIFGAKESKFARFHANQGLALLLAGIVYGIVLHIFSLILLSISWRLGWIVSILGLVWILFLVLAIIGIINAANGKAKELPLIGHFKILK